MEEREGDDGQIRDLVIISILLLFPLVVFPLLPSHAMPCDAKHLHSNRLQGISPHKNARQVSSACNMAPRYEHQSTLQTFSA